MNSGNKVQQQKDREQEAQLEERPTTSFDSVDCFHGFITAKEAEYRLRNCEIDGALILCADQNFTKQKFCLSWLSSSSHSVMHLPITRACGGYFLSGKSFSTLSNLIHAFISESESAVVPLQPPSPVKLIHRQRVAILPFSAMPDTDEISFCEGDLLTEIQRVDNEWAWARLEKNGKSGLVAVQLTVPLNNKNVKPEELPYFHSDPVNVLMHRLTQCGGGCYLLRRSTVHPSSFTLMVNTGAQIEKFQIKQTSNGDFEIGGRVFATIPDIIERYSEKEICNGFYLMRAVLTNTFKGGLSSKTEKSIHHHTHNNFYPQTILATQAYRRCKEDKWKRCHVMLCDSDNPQLYLLDHEKRTKPKVVLDLISCFVYKISDDYFDRPNCLLVCLNGLDICPPVYLSFLNEGTYLNWLNALRIRCFGCLHTTSPFAVIPPMQSYVVRLTTVIHLTLSNFRGGNFKPDYSYSAVVMINGIILARTRQVLPVRNCIIFDACYLLECIPPGPCTLKLELCSHNPSATRARAALLRDQLHKDISPLYLLPDDGRELCTSASNNFEGFLFHAVRHRIVLLPEEQYASFFVLLTTRSFVFSTWIGSVLDPFNRKCFAHLLLSVLLSNYDLISSFIEVVVKEQIRHETELTLFRCDSFCTCCISTALRMIGKDMAVEELANLQTTGQGKQELEVMNILKSLSEHLPLLFRALLSKIIKTSRACFKDSTSIARRVASVFFILRFVNPILTFWNTGWTEKSRHLAKTIQSLANQACSPDYCPQKSSRTVRLMADLLDAVATSPQMVEASENPFCGYSKIDQLGLLAFQVEQVLKHQEPHKCPLPEAYAVISLLKKHAEKYLSS